MQINKFNKLEIEIFSKISAPLKISLIEIKMSQTNLNKELDYRKESPGYFELTKKNPIKIEKSFYLEKEDN